ncbi:MAG: hypothetical protein EBV59_09865 [Synechococcaceae bacterium WB7_1C_051]|nr:hypothetical protein [Synechococcaceae bacterium WB7_1C_051]
MQILVSWNGTDEDEQKIKPGRFETLIAQRSLYHFAKNMNSLAVLAAGEYIALLNDDLILDPHSLDAAISVLELKSDVGLVGGKLRDKQGRLRHAGINFDSRSSAYHQLENFVDADSESANISGVVPAVSGAFMVINKDNFLRLKLNENYQACGEDVELCLDVRENLNKSIWYCAQASGIHEAETTRKQSSGQQADSTDLAKLRERHRRFLQNCDRENLRIEYESTCKESESLRDLILNRPNPIDQENMIKNLEDQLQAKESIMQAHTNTLLTQINTLQAQINTLQEKLNLAIEQNKQLSVEMHTINKLKQTKKDLKQVINEQELKIEDLKNRSAQQDRILTSLQIQLRDLSYDSEKMIKRFKNPLSWFKISGK